jgi:hypothetical protein
MRNTSRITAGLAGLAAALAAVAGLAVAAMLSAGDPAASASAAPKVYVVTQSMGCCYLDPAIKPRTIVLGSEWGVGADFGAGIPRGPMHWTTWSASKGYGTGEFWAALFPGQEFYPARVTLTNVKVHDGRRYFATMKIAANGRTTIWLEMKGGAFTRK